jgi:hypothetical protein
MFVLVSSVGVMRVVELTVMGHVCVAGISMSKSSDVQVGYRVSAIVKGEYW